MAAPSTLSALTLQVLPLALAAAVSPLVLVVQVVTLTRAGSGLREGWSCAAGTAVAVGLWLALGLTVGHALPPRSPGPDPVSAAVPLMLALVLVAIGASLLRRSARAASPPGAPAASAGEAARRSRPPLRHSFLLGLGAMASNLTSLVLVLPASEDLARAGLSPEMEAPLELLMGMITLSPSLAPPLALTGMGTAGSRTLQRLSVWTDAHQNGIGASLCFGFVLLLKSTRPQPTMSLRLGGSGRLQGRDLAPGPLNPLQALRSSRLCRPSRRSLPSTQVGKAFTLAAMHC